MSCPHGETGFCAACVEEAYRRDQEWRDTMIREAAAAGPWREVTDKLLDTVKELAARPNSVEQARDLMMAREAMFELTMKHAIIFHHRDPQVRDMIAAVDQHIEGQNETIRRLNDTVRGLKERIEVMEKAGEL